MPHLEIFLGNLAIDNLSTVNPGYMEVLLHVQREYKTLHLYI